ncbi:MAG TPA: GT4 family glycosyltransferase PelF [Solirubrobacteraceae bacterium]|jgi:glycosyltransferase involved in cell wall biosynthesis|nr:GT4 family glycosyltransferase PelF [Solirubrobacteraceae bacterium]
MNTKLRATANNSPAGSPGAGRHVLIITEGTYPYATGGVSSWCDILLSGLPDIEWSVLPLIAGGRHVRPRMKLPPNATLLRPIELWSQERAPRGLSRSNADSGSLPTQLLRGLMPWQGDLNQLRLALVRCRLRPHSVRREFRAHESWTRFLAELAQLLTEGHSDSAPAPIYDAIEAARLYQSLYWVARTAAVPTPPCDLLHVTAAGWAAIPAIVHKAMHGTPILLSEHGVYVREAYLASISDTAGRPGHGATSPRLALGLTRAAYAAADMIAPVTEANGEWEMGLGVNPDKIRVIPNGIEPSLHVGPARGTKRVVAIGRVDPLKDVQTMMLVAQEVTRRMPEARFEYWGPVTSGQEQYGEACQRMHRQLGLGERFRFMGRTEDPHAVIRDADVVLMTSISEGMPMALLEAMAQARPVVATTVGGVPGVVKGCGLLAPPGDVHELASSVTTLLRNPSLARTLGQRGFERLHRRYTLSRCLGAYGTLIQEMTATGAPA